MRKVLRKRAENNMLNLIFITMMKVKVFGAVVIIALACFIWAGVNTEQGNELSRQNVDALANGEVTGHCSEAQNSCIFVCDNCGAKYEAMGSHKGGSYGMSGNCSECSNPVK